MTAEVQFESRGAVLIVTFDRADKGNAFTAIMAKLLADKLKAVSDDRGVRAILLRGQGDQFMAGHDLAAYMGETLAVQDQIYQKAQHYYAAIRELMGMERPVIAAVDGHVSGAGFSFMLASDLVVATKRTVFNAGFVVNAMLPDGGATFSLPRKVGVTRANEIFMLNEEFSSEKALQWGLINRVVADDALQADSMALAEKLAAGPTRTIGAAKRMINKSFDNDMGQHLSVESTTWNAIAKSFDFREAMKASAAKREPKFTGT